MNTVDQPTAARLKEAGWTGETKYRHVRFGAIWRLLHEGEYGFYGPYGNSDWLPTPNIAELREKLKEGDFQDYFDKVVWLGDRDAQNIPYWSSVVGWLFTVTTDPNTLAQIWIWKSQKEAP